MIRALPKLSRKDLRSIALSWYRLAAHALQGYELPQPEFVRRLERTYHRDLAPICKLHRAFSQAP